MADGKADYVQTPPPPYDEYGPRRSAGPALSTKEYSSEQYGSVPHEKSNFSQISSYSNENKQMSSRGSVGIECQRGCLGKKPSKFVQDMKQVYRDKRRAKEASRKVDFYEKMYGFVPKNAVTEAEWRDARERVPKTKVPFKGKSSGGLSIAAIGGIGGGC